MVNMEYHNYGPSKTLVDFAALCELCDRLKIMSVIDIGLFLVESKVLSQRRLLEKFYQLPDHVDGIDTLSEPIFPIYQSLYGKIYTDADWPGGNWDLAVTLEGEGLESYTEAYVDKLLDFVLNNAAYWLFRCNDFPKNTRVFKYSTAVSTIFINNQKYSLLNVLEYLKSGLLEKLGDNQYGC